MKAVTMTPDAGLQPLRRPLLTLLLGLSTFCTLPTLLADPLAAQDQRPEILSYEARIEVRDGGVLRVTESIRVRAVRPDVRMGIERDVPVKLSPPERFGTAKVPFSVLSATRDGEPVSYRTETATAKDGRRVHRVIMSDGWQVPAGVYDYTLRYETARWIRFHDDGARLRWNVTTHEWGFPIRSATAVLDLPDRPVEGSVELEAWTGSRNALTREGASWSWDEENTEARFRTTGLLNVGEALVVEAAWPGGLVPAPTAQQKDAWFWLDWGPWVEAGTVVGLVLTLYLLIWGWVGRDPSSAPRSFRREPPEGLSPAALGFLERRGYHLSQLTASLVSLAVKGIVTLEKDSPWWIIRSTDREPEDVPPEERRLYEASMGKWESLILKGRTNSRLRKGARALREELENRKRPHFFTNRGWFVLGLVASLAGFGVLVWRARDAIAYPAGALGGWLAAWTAGTAFLLFITIRQWQLVPYEDLDATRRALGVTVMSSLFVGSWVLVAWMVYHLVPTFLVAAATVLAGVNVLFYHLLKRPTERGRKILDELEGFRRFLRGREAERAEGPPPGRSPDLFQRHLPYAMVLGMEEEWGARFDDGADSGLGERGSGTAVPDWYSGPGEEGKASEVAQSLAGSLNAFVSAATVQTSSGRRKS